MNTTLLKQEQDRMQKDIDIQDARIAFLEKLLGKALGLKIEHNKERGETTVTTLKEKTNETT